MRRGGVLLFFFFFFTLVTGLRRSLSLKLSDTRVYEPQMPGGVLRAQMYSHLICAWCWLSTRGLVEWGCWPLSSWSPRLSGAAGSRGLLRGPAGSHLRREPTVMKRKVGRVPSVRVRAAVLEGCVPSEWGCWPLSSWSAWGCWPSPAQESERASRLTRKACGGGGALSGG